MGKCLLRSIGEQETVSGRVHRTEQEDGMSTCITCVLYTV